MTVPTTRPSSNPIMHRILTWGGALAIAIAVVAGVIGGLAVGWVGVTSALLGTALAVVFLGLTAASILLANRFAGSDAFIGAFFGIVLGGWLLKIIVFIVVVVLLKGQPWINPTVMFFSIVAAVIGSLAVDVIVVLKSRMPYVSDASATGSSGTPADES